MSDKILYNGSDKWKIKATQLLDDFTGATTSANGKDGVVPAPLAGEEKKYLRADGTWSDLDFSQLSASQIADLQTALGI